DVHVAGEAGEGARVVVARSDEGCGPCAAGVGRRGVEDAIDAEGDAGQGEHLAELSTAEDADFHRASGSGLSRTARVCSSRNCWSAARTRESCVPMTAAARSAALTAPAVPMARVPTGMPAGIWTIESSESRPFSARD